MPFKDEVLTRTARHWFEATGDICPNHVLTYPDPNVVVARRLDILPVEMVVRGYLAGTTGTSVTAAQWEEASALSLALFARGQAMAAERGLILADTKYEFGTDAEGRILLADEIHTPDSSRFWRAASYESRFAADERPESFDKDFVRSWVAARCDPYHDEIPPIPASLILATSAVYIEAFETITGQSFTLRDPGEDLLARVRRNLAGM